MSLLLSLGMYFSFLFFLQWPARLELRGDTNAPLRSVPPPAPLFSCLFAALAPPVTAVLSTRPLPAHCVSTLSFTAIFWDEIEHSAWSREAFVNCFWNLPILRRKTSCRVYWKDSANHVDQSVSIVKGQGGTRIYQQLKKTHTLPKVTYKRNILPAIEIRWWLFKC